MNAFPSTSVPQVAPPPAARAYEAGYRDGYAAFEPAIVYSHTAPHLDTAYRTGYVDGQADANLDGAFRTAWYDVDPADTFELTLLGERYLDGLDHVA